MNRLYGSVRSNQRRRQRASLSDYSDPATLHQKRASRYHRHVYRPADYHEYGSSSEDEVGSAGCLKPISSPA
jgi:hypothetical protein